MVLDERAAALRDKCLNLAKTCQSLAEVGSIVCHGPVDDPKGGWGLSIFSAKDQTEVERLTAADPIILDDVGARYEILPMKQFWMKGAN
jgi:uncharacterized protein YciI